MFKPIGDGYGNGNGGGYGTVSNSRIRRSK